jgi:phosphohistidine phosphatase SixA
MLRALLILLVAALPLAAQERAPTTVILVRHAEKAAAPADDPPLSKAGQARARALFEVVRDAGVTAIITTQFVRTRETARPSAVALKIAPEIVPASAGVQHPADVAHAALAHAGGVVLVVGHSNTVPAIVAALGAPRPPPICDSSYDGIYVVTVPASGPARLVSARYGAPSPADANCASMMR